MPKREDPLVVFKFGLEIEGKLTGFFTQVSGIGSETEVVDHKIVNADTGETIIQKLPGRLTWTDVSLRRGVTSNLDIWNWRKSVVQGNIEKARTNCAIIAYSQENKPVARWEFVNAWPSRVVGPELDAGAAQYMIEEVVIVHEGMDRVSV
jgi:phage tail-like protein